MGAPPGVFESSLDPVHLPRWRGPGTVPRHGGRLFDDPQRVEGRVDVSDVSHLLVVLPRRLGSHEHPDGHLFGDGTGTFPRLPPGSGVGGGGAAVGRPLPDFRPFRLSPVPAPSLPPLCPLSAEAARVRPAILFDHPVSTAGLRVDGGCRVFNVRRHVVAARHPSGVRGEPSRHGGHGVFPSHLPFDRSDGRRPQSGLGRGRKKTVLEGGSGVEVALGVDIGGTKVAAGLVSAAGECLHYAELPSASEDGDDVSAGDEWPSGK